MPRTDGAWVQIGGAYKRHGRSDRTPAAPVSTFVLGTTKPADGDNCGVDPAVTLTTYAGAGAGGTLNPTSGQTFTNVDFGTTHIGNSNSASNVTFTNCKFTNNGNTGPAIVNLDDNNHTGWTFTRCTFDNIHQYAYNVSGIRGNHFTATRCSFLNMVDGLDPMPPSSNPDSDIATQLLGCFIDKLAWYWNPSSGVVHPSGQYTHNDGFQWQGGKNLRVEGCYLTGGYSTTIGTGTPNSGSDTAGVGASTAPYTQATGVTQRAAIVDGGGTYATGQPGAHLGGSISALMFTPVGRGTDLTGLVIKNNWGRGGSFWMNAGDDTITGTIAEISGNRVDNDQRNAGWAFGIDASIAITNFGSPANVWTDSGSTIVKRNG